VSHGAQRDCVRRSSNPSFVVSGALDPVPKYLTGVLWQIDVV
jgi:hypothetical protein